MTGVDAFLERTNQRTLPPDYRGNIFVWDIDKTYLDTHFSSMRGLLRIPFEFAIDKVSVPGATPLLRALRRGPGVRPQVVPLYFVSGSPVQLRRVIERKMTLDGVEFDGITFKDQWGLLRARRPAGIKEQVGYKLRALLLYYRDMPSRHARWMLFGDDVESDAEVFTLFGEVVAGLRGAELEQVLEGHGVHPSDREAIFRLLEEIPAGENPVEKIFIHLSRQTPPEKLATDRVVPTRSFLQAALVLASLEKIQPAAITAVATDLRRRGMVREAELKAQLEDAQLRLGIADGLLQLAG